MARTASISPTSANRRRAAYFALWSEGDTPSPGDSIKKKVAAQIAAWTDLGVDAKLFLVASQPCERSWRALLGDDRVHVDYYAHRVDRVRAYEKSRRAIEAWQPAFLYLRQEPWAPSFEVLLRRIPAFMELNGDEISEARGAPKRYLAYRWLSRKLMLSKVAGFVSVAEELLHRPALARLERPAVVIANGIALERFSILPPVVDGPLTFGFLGARHGAAWHGVDKLLDLAGRRSDWRFELVGMERSDLGLSPHDLPNVTAHGVLTRDRYERVLARCDAAFGTLSAYKKDCHEASPLKVRESLACGLPVINGVRDTDFPQDVPFVLRLPNAEGNVVDNVDSIERFTSGWRGRRVSHADIGCLDSALKERRRMAFVESVLAGQTGSAP